MNLSDRLRDKGIVSNELLGGQFERIATYKADGTLWIEATPDFKEDVGRIEGQQIVLQDWEEICKLRDFLNGLAPITINQQLNEVKHLERASA